MSASIYSSPLNTTSTSISVSWSGIDVVTYPSVRIDMFLTSDFAKFKPGQYPQASANNNKGGLNSPSTPPISTANGFPLPFTGLTPSTSYTFILYGWHKDPNSADATQPILLATSDPISTLAAQSAPTPKPQPSVNYPDLYPYPYPKDLNNTNRVQVTIGNPELFVQWYITLDGVADHNSIAPLGNYRFETSPGETYRISASGKLVSTGVYTNSPDKVQTAGPNSHSVQQFLSNSGVDGRNGIRQFVVNSKSASVRGMLGI